MYRHTMRCDDNSIYIKDVSHLSEKELIDFLANRLAETEDKLLKCEEAFNIMCEVYKNDKEMLENWNPFTDNYDPIVIDDGFGFGLTD